MEGSHTAAHAGQDRDERAGLRLVSTAAAGLPPGLAGRLDGHLGVFAAHVREGLLASAVAVGLEVMNELIDAEVTGLCGSKGGHDPQRTATRWGGEAGSVTLGGRRLGVRRPRVRSVGADAAEVALTSYGAFADADLLADGIVARMLAGISTRRYGVALEPVGAEVEAAAKGTSKSQVSRRFAAATAERLAELMGRDLSGQRWAIVMLDGFGLGEHTMVAALGITADGVKVPLGVVEGSTENAAVCTRLVAGLADRGLDASLGLLFVIDGGKALTKAIRAVYGAKALIQRCRRHKERNVLDHLPDDERPLIQRQLRDAWRHHDPEVAITALRALAAALQRKRPGAAASLREGLEDTITINRLGVTGKLRQTIESTNPAESMIEIVRDHATRVKHWQHGEMALRWAAAGMHLAETQFRRVKGHAELPLLLAALEHATSDEPGLLDLPTAVTA